MAERTTDTAEIPLREKLSALYRAAVYRPVLGAVSVGLSLLTALTEGIGLGFLLPIIESTQSGAAAQNADGILVWFVRLYETLGVPFTIGYLILGVVSVMTIRFAASFVSDVYRAKINIGYQRFLRQQLYTALMFGPIDYLDRVGSDSLLNTIITEANRAGSLVRVVYRAIGIVIRGSTFVAIAVIVSPVLTAVALAGLGASTLFIRYVLKPAYATGEEIAEANDRIQSVSQAGIQGMRDIRLFNLRAEYIQRMEDVLDRFVETSVSFRRNQSAMGNVNQFTNAIVVFSLVYAGLELTGLSLGEIGLFLFAVYRLSPLMSQMNTLVYGADGELPHLIRVQSRIDELESMETEDSTHGRSVQRVDEVTFEDVSFSYDDEPVLRDVSFTVARGERVALVGQSGAGKSTIVALLARLQTPDHGQIMADDTPIDEFAVDEWRERIAVVRQDPYIFDGTLQENVTIGNRNATRADVEHACETAQVTEFLSELSDGYKTELGEDGVRLSGGQKQRVAIARALLKPADVLVLDEATSDLDSTIEQDVYRGIRQQDGQYATISIAHRLSTVRESDRIYMLEDGSITGVGTHEVLIQRGDLYAELYETQD